MPALDLSDILSDPDLCEPMTVYRQIETVGTNGRASMSRLRVSPDPIGSIQPKDSVIGGNVLERTPDGEYRAAALLAWSKFRFRSASATADGYQWQPDIVAFNGDDYLVTLTNDYTHYGQGFVQAELTSLPTQDTPPPDTVAPPVPFEAFAVYIPGLLRTDGDPVLVADMPAGTDFTTTVVQAIAENPATIGQTLPLQIQVGTGTPLTFATLVWSTGQTTVALTFSGVHFTEDDTLVIPPVSFADPSLSDFSISFG